MGEGKVEMQLYFPVRVSGDNGHKVISWKGLVEPHHEPLLYSELLSTWECEGYIRLSIFGPCPYPVAHGLGQRRREAVYVA